MSTLETKSSQGVIPAGKEADVKEAHKLIVEKLGHAEVLIYNAGMGSFANIGR